MSGNVSPLAFGVFSYNRYEPIWVVVPPALWPRGRPWGVVALGLGHLAGILRSLLWVLVALLLWQLELEWLGRLSLGFALAPPAYPV